jgi:outer membrane protein
LLNLGVKKNWPDTTVTWYNNDALGGVNVVNDDDVDPWIFSARVGYRFNLGDAFGRQA